jgi:hypothetical protein
MVPVQVRRGLDSMRHHVALLLEETPDPRFQGVRQHQVLI